MANEKRFFTKIVDFESFSKVLNRPGGFRDPGEPEEYCRGFQVFDKDMTGFIGVGQLRYSECLNRYDTSHKLVNLVFRLLPPSPLFCCDVGVGTKVLTHSSLFIVLTNLGEKMSDEEVDELLKAVDTSSGEINYTGTHALLWPSFIALAVCIHGRDGTQR